LKKNSFYIQSRHTVKKFIANFKQLRGDPHYISMGMAVGVFIGVTPTFPFHTTLAIALAVLLRGSKTAAALGVWFGNPLTMPFFYIGSYELGMLLLGRSLPSHVLQQHSVKDMLTIGVEATSAMIAGGVLLGILPAVIAYFVTYKMLSKMNVRDSERAEAKSCIKFDGEEM